MTDFLPDFSRKLLGLCQMMISVRYASLALQIPVSTLFLKDLADILRTLGICALFVTCGHGVLNG